jgi:hypothetical protein
MMYLEEVVIEMMSKCFANASKSNILSKLKSQPKVRCPLSPIFLLTSGIQPGNVE